MSKSEDNELSGEFTWAMAFRDIGVKSISSGQFPLFCLFFLLVIILVRVPSEAISGLASQFFACQATSKAGFYIFIFIYTFIGYLFFLFFRRRLSAMMEDNQALRDKVKQLSSKENAE